MFISVINIAATIMLTVYGAAMDCVNAPKNLVLKVVGCHSRAKENRRQKKLLKEWYARKEKELRG